MENEKKRFVEQELNSDDYREVENWAKVVREAGIMSPVLIGTFVVIKKHGPKLLKAISNLI